MSPKNMRAYKLALRRAERHLAGCDRSMARVIETHGRCALEPAWDRSPYESLVRAVAHQQLHGRAAETILGRLVARYPGRPFPDPAELLQTPLAELRACGFSLAKATTLHGIASGALSGVVPNREESERSSDAELIERISSLRGIGRWTVEMLLIFTLGRFDVMPIDDFGVRAGLQAIYGLKTSPKKAEFAAHTDAWSPYRSIGAWYLWREADRLKTAANAR